jgi:hypothetical protein
LIADQFLNQITYDDILLANIQLTVRPQQAWGISHDAHLTTTTALPESLLNIRLNLCSRLIRQVTRPGVFFEVKLDPND